MYTMILFIINNITWKDNYLRSAGMILYHTIKKNNFQYEKLGKIVMVRLVLLLSNYKSKVTSLASLLT